MILVGARKDSETYVRNKKKACAEVGIADFGTDLPEDASEEQVLAVRQSSHQEHLSPLPAKIEFVQCLE